MKSKSVCKKRLSEKIKINMSERKTRGWSRSQAVAISYSQIKKSFPRCNSVLNKRKSVKRKSLKRKSLKRKSLKRKSLKRKSLKRRKSLFGSGNFFIKPYSKKTEYNKRIPELASDPRTLYSTIITDTKQGKRETEKDYIDRLNKELGKKLDELLRKT